MLLWGLRQPCVEVQGRDGGDLGGLGGKEGLTGEGKSDAHFVWLFYWECLGD